MPLAAAPELLERLPGARAEPTRQLGLAALALVLAGAVGW